MNPRLTKKYVPKRRYKTRRIKKGYKTQKKKQSRRSKRRRVRSKILARGKESEWDKVDAMPDPSIIDTDWSEVDAMPGRSIVVPEWDEREKDELQRQNIAITPPPGLQREPVATRLQMKENVELKKYLLDALPVFRTIRSILGSLLLMNQTIDSHMDVPTKTTNVINQFVSRLQGGLIGLSRNPYSDPTYARRMGRNKRGCFLFDLVDEEYTTTEGHIQPYFYGSFREDHPEYRSKLPSYEGATRLNEELIECLRPITDIMKNIRERLNEFLNDESLKMMLPATGSYRDRSGRRKILEDLESSLTRILRKSPLLSNDELRALGNSPTQSTLTAHHQALLNNKKRLKESKRLAAIQTSRSDTLSWLPKFKAKWPLMYPEEGKAYEEMLRGDTQRQWYSNTREANEYIMGRK